MTHDDNTLDENLAPADLDETLTEEVPDLLEDEASTKEVEPDFFPEDKGFLGDDNMNPYLTDEMTDFLNDRITDYSAIGKNAGKQNITAGKNLNKVRGISISIAKKEDILAQSHGEILISETINYRTQRPERGGLFCEQIFGPRKNYECACGKYKRIRYKGIICERCGVEVTTSQVRRQRMAHIELASPVAHIWFLKSVPSRVGLMLDIPVKKLDQVVYFAAYLIIDVHEDFRKDALAALEDRFKQTRTEMQKEFTGMLNEAKIAHEAGEMKEKAVREMERDCEAKLEELDEEYREMRDKLVGLVGGNVISELDYRLLMERFPQVFTGGTGAEAIRQLLDRVDLAGLIQSLQADIKVAPKSKEKKLLQKLRLSIDLFSSNQHPRDFIMEALQILPPDLRPMIQLDGGRMASSDLNDLYRRVINRNNRLKKLIQLGAPEVILKNEKRMLQESADALISGSVRSSRSGYAMANKRKLKSLTDILKGKQGRFRQNLLGKRVDYSGRSVIVVGPNLAMDHCGLPKTIALTLFRPFVIGKLIEREYAFNVKHAEKIIEENTKEVWDALEEVIEGKYVLLNRAPTLHRLGIQAFRPTLVEGKAIHLHPLTCVAFNADFDGDQMAVHLPLTPEAQREARELMATSANMLNPSNGEPIVSPTQDMILGCYFLTKETSDSFRGQVFASYDDASIAFMNGEITLHTQIRVRGWVPITKEGIYTTYGRMRFHAALPTGYPFQNTTMTKKNLSKLLSDIFEIHGTSATAVVANEIKNLGFKYATMSGLSISESDMLTPKNKGEILEKATEKVRTIQSMAYEGFLTDEERYDQSIRIWSQAKNTIEAEMKKVFPKENHIYHFIDSGARGSWGNVTQLCGMKGLVASPSGKTIELPIKSNFKEGLTALEYFIATHGGRKGKADTALKTAQSGYMTRRLVDAAQNILVRENDCGTLHFEDVNRASRGVVFEEPFEERIYGKILAKDLLNGKTTLAHKGDIIDQNLLTTILATDIQTVPVRSILNCETHEGICQHCYGMDLARNRIVDIGTPIGIVAAQSIGEPGTQLTMRTFHTGGAVKEGGDITTGLTRVEELFEARTPKYLSKISHIDGEVTKIEHTKTSTAIFVRAHKPETREYYIPHDYEQEVKTGETIKAKQMLARNPETKQKILATTGGIVSKVENGIIYVSDTEAQTLEYVVPFGRKTTVQKGEQVHKGDKLCEGNIEVEELMTVAGPARAQQYIVDAVKEIYASQGQTVNAKHVSCIVRQMFSKVTIIEPGESEFFQGDTIDIGVFNDTNKKLVVDGKKQAIGQRLVLGIAKVSLHSDSWLSAASFQETVKVLVDAASKRRIDHLQDIKSNVIIGRRIPTLQYFQNNLEPDEQYYEGNVTDITEVHSAHALVPDVE